MKRNSQENANEAIKAKPEVCKSVRSAKHVAAVGAHGKKNSADAGMGMGMGMGMGASAGTGMGTGASAGTDASPVFLQTRVLMPFAALLLALAAGALGLKAIASAAPSENAAQEVPAISSDSKAVLSSTADYRKTEVVYATLDGQGKPLSAYVVNQFDLKQPGRVVDFGPYESVKNLSTEDELLQQDDAVAFDMMEPGVFYYEGDSALSGADTAAKADRSPSSLTLPWNIALEYFLDEKRLSCAEELSGASGALRIRLSTSPNSTADSSFFDSFLLQITFTVPAEAASELKAQDATIASAGENRTVTFTVLPGNNADCTLEAVVKDFHMDGVQIAALPYASPLEMPDPASMSTQLDGLTDAASELSQGAQDLSSGAGQYALGMSQLSDGVSKFDAEQLRSSLAFIQNSLTLTFASLYELQSMDAEQLSALGETFFELADFLEWLKGLDPDEYELPERYLSFDFDTAIAKCRNVGGYLTRNAAQIAQLIELSKDPQKAAEASGRLSELSSSLLALQEGVLHLNEGAQDLADGTQTYAQGAEAFSSATADIPDAIKAAADEMMADYTFPVFEPHSFASDKNPADKIAGVQFVLQTTAIDQAKTATEAPTSDQSTFLDRLLALFGMK